jgi:hypothetical protein
MLNKPFRIALEMAYFYRPDAKIEAWRQRNADRSAVGLKDSGRTAGWFSGYPEFGLALMPSTIIHLQLMAQSAGKKLSPFENGLQTEWRNRIFIKINYYSGFESQNYGFKYTMDSSGTCLSLCFW